MDARQVKTREALYAALLSLLEEKSLEHIAIREIARTAGVGHATFYRHYPDKESLLGDLAEDQIRRLVDLTLPVMYSADNKAACLTLAQHVKQHNAIWSTLLTGGAASRVKEELLRIARDVSQQVRIPPPDVIPTDLKTLLTVSAILESLSWWLRQTRPISAEKMAVYLDHIIMS